MTTAVVFVCSIISTIFCISNVSAAATQAVVKVPATASPTRLVKLKAVRTNPYTLMVTWTPESHNFQNATVQLRQLGAIEWENSMGNSSETVNSLHTHYVVLKSSCLTYEIRLKFQVGEATHGQFEYSETVLSEADIPKQVESLKLTVVRNFYNNLSNTIDVVVSIQNHSLAFWPLDSRELQVEGHVISSQSGQTNEESYEPQSIPSVHWVSSSEGYLRYDESYVKATKAGGSTDIMVAAIAAPKICGRQVDFDKKLIDDPTFVKLSCSTTSNLTCLPEVTKKKAPPPRCNPQSVNILQAPAGDGTSETELKVQWEFPNAGSEEPRQIFLRYGYYDFDESGDSLSFLKPSNEIDRFEVDGASRNATLRTKKTPPESNQASHRFYRMSICAIYGEPSDESKINWDIVPSFFVKTIQSEPQKQCRCEENGNHIREQVTKAETTMMSTTRAPPIVSSPSNTYESYWIKVAPLLVVFSVMTVLNLVLFMASYYFYKRARQMNAMK